jgi:glycosyltransferase involved in cell wall biosynthesis
MAPERSDEGGGDGDSRSPTALDPADHAFVVLAFGASPFLPACLESLRRQTARGFVVVATSTPCDFIARAADGAGIEVVVNPDREGIAADWNFALNLTDARFVTLAHQDDVYAPAFLARTLAALARDDGVLCFTSYQEIDDDGASRTSRISRAKHLLEHLILGGARRVGGWRLRAFLSFGNPLPCPSVTYDRAKLAGFRFSSDFASNLDWDAWWRLMAARARFTRVPERLVGRRHNALTTTSRLLEDGTRAAEDLIMFRRAWPRPISDWIARAYRLAG